MNKRPEDATHRDKGGNLYKLGDELNWLRWGDDEWFIYGTVPVGALCPITQPPAAPPLPCAPLPPPVLNPFVEHWSELFKSYRFVGSRVTVDPPPLDTDQDVLCLVDVADRAAIEHAMNCEGFVHEGSCPADMDLNTCEDNTFFSMRKGDMNYIITTSDVFYKRFSAATDLAKLYNLQTKAERVQLFQAVLYGNWVKP